MLLGCCDLQNAFATVASKVGSGGGKLNIYLNHPCLVSFARNVLILKVVSDQHFNVDDRNMDYLWDLWYNVEWPQNTLERFEKDVKSLIEEELPDEQHFHLNKSQLDSLKDVWSSWLFTAGETLTQPLNMENVLKDR